ncbi:hypothetical protein FK529_13010 [Tsukamurella asaccharolytica]|uniref:Uncharacterized protein n=1 Tax=Tsukamurella asaccharolytica TaxID=2592067 RepID=A0A5C5R7U4_9ACTN|nr:hypothetical protein [Tsukamurella asaccharolytica]TWS18898.1 hypothetical protein FK529_13010 [Tsukamurella asaccharolytica]
MTPSGDPTPRKYSARDIARIFGDVLPSQTRDDLSDDAAPRPGAASPVAGSDGDSTDRWYRENRPPHHGG